MNNILVRSLSGAVFISLILVPLFLENSIIAISVFFGFMILGIVEYGKLFKNVPSVQINWKLNTFFSVLISIVITFSILKSSLLYIFAVFPLIIIWNSTELWRKKQNPLLNIGISLFGFIYICIPFILAIYIDFLDKELFPLLAGMFILIWTNDTFAFLSGKFFGRTKLFERISPKKTWEGTIGGIVCTFLMAYGISTLFYTDQLLFWLISVLFIVPAAIYGDLLESLFKRSLGIKDSGNIMPGHGGILDRFDAAFFAIPLFLFWLHLYKFLF